MSKADFFATQDLEEIFFVCLPQYIICFFVQLSSSWHATRVHVINYTLYYKGIGVQIHKLMFFS